MPIEKPWWTGVDRSKSGEKSREGDDVRWTWFSPVDAPRLRIRYAVIQEEGRLLSIQPGEGRFKTGLEALRWTAEKDGESTRYVVRKTRPTRIDLELVEA
jgi:hypothetical protein